ncbi:MAG: DNA gyrase inhibitor YacG, partial [Burkholderiaceae bacterium]
NPYRPFCSVRCRQIDLGAWASEEFRMPTEAPPEDAEFGDPRRQD